MKCIRDWGSKLKIVFSGLGSKIKAIISTFFSIVGFLLAIGEGVDSIFECRDILDCYKNYIVWWIIGIALVSIIINRNRLKHTTKICGATDVSITINVGSVFRGKGAVIVPTNSTFDTTMVDDFISPDSVQGQYQLKYYKGKPEELDKLIKVGLSEEDQYKLLRDRTKTNNKQYPIGTVCRILGEKTAYFLADSNINKNGIPDQEDVSDICIALTKLWDSLCEIGNKEPYFIPLLGTGKARVRNATKDEIVRLIVTSFLAAVRDKNITDSLVICVHPNDYKDIDWDGLCEYIDYQCKYSNIIPSINKIEGRKEKAEVLNEAELPQDVITKGMQEIIDLLRCEKLTCQQITVKTGITMSTTRKRLDQLMDCGALDVSGTPGKRLYSLRKEFLEKI